MSVKWRQELLLAHSTKPMCVPNRHVCCGDQRRGSHAQGQCRSGNKVLSVSAVTSDLCSEERKMSSHRKVALERAWIRMLEHTEPRWAEPVVAVK